MIQDIFLIPLYVVLVVVPEVLFNNYVDRLRADGHGVILPLSIFSIDVKLPAVPQTPLDLFLLLAFYVGYTVFFEESVFRIAPMLAMGVYGLVAGSVAWALLHNVKMYSSNRHLRYDVLRKLIVAHSLLFVGIAGFYIYATYLNMAYPYIFHSLNNALVVIKEYMSINSKPKRLNYIEGGGETAGAGGKVVATARAQSLYVGDVALSFIEREEPKYVFVE